MDALTYKTLQNNAKAYMATLNLDEVKKEFSKFPSLLNQNKKLSKGDLMNFGLELTPSKFVSSFNMCGGEGKCLFTCLAFSGIDNMLKSKSLELSNTLKKRIRRTFLFIQDKEWFLNRLTIEIDCLSKIYKTVAIRLNVFSDINWDNYLDLSEVSSNVTFYDYTKKFENTANKNIYFTYSASEKDSEADLIALLNRKINVAVVFDANSLPTNWNGFKVIDGDLNDNRYNDEKGVVVGLRLKTTIGGKGEGKAKKVIKIAA
jgi:hypothetical protein